MAETLTNREARELKGRAQRMRPMFVIGREGLSAAFLKSLDQALSHHELVKVKFGEFKEQKKETAPLLAEKVSARLIMRVGNVAVLFRRKSEPEKQGAINPAVR